MKLEHRRRNAYLKGALVRSAEFFCDSLIMAVAYLCAFILRFDFSAPPWGWRATACSFTTVWVVQAAMLWLWGCYRTSWRFINVRTMFRFFMAAISSSAVLLIIRILLPSVSSATLRPPFSISILNGVLLLAGLVLWRVLRVRFSVLRSSERDLLGRNECLPDVAAMVDFMRNRTVLITGAGGSIGSELVRQVVRYAPARVVMVERNENALYEIDREIRSLGSEIPCSIELADVMDEARMLRIFERYRPQLVLHAAAFKHVPMIEQNPVDGLRNNTLATRRLGELSAEFGVERFVLISTDKAVNPLSVMGCTKRLAEVAALDLNGSSQTRFSAVRFGNVLGSSGSVVPLFREQIAKHLPVTVTHPEMRRYFMSAHEAVSLVLQAATIAEGGEVFVLDMGEPVKILDLAEEMIAQQGYLPYLDIPIAITGVRPGEKLFEELDISEQSAIKTGCARIFICKTCSSSRDRVVAVLEKAAVIAKGDIDALAAKEEIRKLCEGL